MTQSFFGTQKKKKKKTTVPMSTQPHKHLRRNKSTIEVLIRYTLDVVTAKVRITSHDQSTYNSTKIYKKRKT